jgi:hypothetical protein
MNFDDLFAELEQKFETMQLRNRSAASSSDGSNLSIKLRTAFALPGQPIRATLDLRHASVGADCIAGFDASLDYWLILRLTSVDEFASEQLSEAGLFGALAGFSFHSLLAELDLPKPAWIRRSGESRLSRLNLTLVTPQIIQNGYPPAARFTPIVNVEAIVIDLI